MTTAWEARAARVTSQPSARFDARAFARDLHEAYDGGLLHLTGDAGRDIVQLHSEGDDLGALYFHEYIGKSATGLDRFWGAFSHEPGQLELELFIVVTKHDQEADSSLFGHSGTDIGNPVLVARAYDIAIEVACVNGVRSLINNWSTSACGPSTQPWDGATVGDCR